MSFIRVFSRAHLGMDAPLVTVEAHLSRGLPSFSIVGLPETAVRESRDRVRSAIIEAGFDFPRQRITVNLAPADLPKEGGRYDLAIAIGILLSTQQIESNKIPNLELLGELGLSGSIRPIPGVLPAVLASRKEKRTLLIPAANHFEASLVREADVVIAHHLTEVIQFLISEKNLPSVSYQPPDPPDFESDWSEVIGQPHAKRALEIAIAGGHHALLVGPPGSGKTMLAQRLPTIMTELSEEEALEVATIYSTKIGLHTMPWRRAPFRSPHHTASAIAVIGGGSKPQPGEVSLAHHGILFLDELPEFNRNVLEGLREPLESGSVHIARAKAHISFPARFQLIATMNPCPCGYWGSNQKKCRCTFKQVQQYQQRISGPMLDRIDMQILVPPVDHDLLLQKQTHKMVGTQSETSLLVRQRISAAQQLQYNRFQNLNGQTVMKYLEPYTKLNTDSQKILQRAMNKLNLSARSLYRILRVSRTIADLDQAEHISSHHLAEALSYRALEQRQVTHLESVL